MNGSIGQLPAPAPCPASDASTRVTPSSTATTELATASDEVLVGVDAELGGRVEDVAVGADPVPDAVHGQPAAGVGDVDAVRAVGLHELGLPGQFGRLGAMWDIIRKPETSMPSSRAVAMCWAATSASVQCVAIRTDRTPRS